MLSSFFKRLLMGRQLEFAEGDIEILETKFTMHSLSHYFYWREFEKQKHGKSGLIDIYEVGKQTGKEVAKSYKDKFKLEGIESANFWKNIIELSGLAKIKMIDPKEGGKVLIQLESSFAKHYSTKKQKSPENVDEYLTGMLTGVFEEMYGRELAGEETKCSTTGNAFCEIVIKPKK